MGCGGLVQALMGLLAVPEPVGLGPAADAPRLPCLCWAVLPALATSEGSEGKAHGECGRLLLISFCPSLLLPQASPGRTGHGACTGLARSGQGGSWKGRGHHTPAKPESSGSPLTPCAPSTWALPLDTVFSHRAAVQKMLQGVCIYPLSGHSLFAGPLRDNDFPCMIPSVSAA